MNQPISLHLSSNDVTPVCENVYSFFEQAVQTWPDRCALSIGEDDYTYLQLEAEADRLLPALLESRLFRRRSLNLWEERFLNLWASGQLPRPETV